MISLVDETLVKVENRQLGRNNQISRASLPKISAVFKVKNL